MKITNYSFGSITINGNTYSKDVLIYTGHVHSPWWRKEGHVLQPVDLPGLFQEHPSLLIVGTGYHGTMLVPKETRDYFTSHRIKVIIKKTGEAVDQYNENVALPGVIAAFHLTC